MVKNKRRFLICKRCGWMWFPRKDKVFVCPKCHSPLWNISKDSDKND